MWTMFQGGFVSAVQDWNDPSIMRVRARDKISLQNVLQAIKDSGHDTKGLKIVEGKGTDYRWRILMPRDLYTQFLVQVSSEIDYGNFKDQVTKTRGKKFHDALMDVWYAMLAVNDKQPVRKSWAGQLTKV